MNSFDLRCNDVTYIIYIYHIYVQEFVLFISGAKCYVYAQVLQMPKKLRSMQLYTLLQYEISYIATYRCNIVTSEN